MQVFHANVQNDVILLAFGKMFIKYRWSYTVFVKMAIVGFITSLPSPLEVNVLMQYTEAEDSGLSWATQSLVVLSSLMFKIIS